MPKKQRSAPRYLDPNCRLGRFMADTFKELCPNARYRFMELMGDGEVIFHIIDEDNTRFGIDIMTFVSRAARVQEPSND